MMIAILHLLLCISFEFLLVCGLFQPHSSNISNEITIFAQTSINIALKPSIAISFLYNFSESKSILKTGPTALTKTPISKQTSSSIAKVTKTVSPTASTAISKVLISSTINAPITTITTTTVSTTASIRNCAVGWLEYEDHCYLFNKRANGKTWIDAQLSCQSYGGNLLSLADQAENSFIRRYTGPASRLYEDYWIGLNDIQTEGTYVWSDNTTPVFNNWIYKEPSALTEDEDCVETTLFGWNDINCNSDSFGFICKKKKENGNCSGIWSEYDWKNGSHCYYFHTAYNAGYGFTWKNSLLYCQSNGGNLLSVSNQEENVFIFNNLNAKRSTYGDLQYWIGLNDIQKEGKYEWTDNTTLAYFNWRNNQPNNINVTDDCVVMQESKANGWNDINCNIICGFVCKTKKDPCLKYNVIDDFRRSTAFRVTPGDPIVCNNSFDADWYRFTSGAGGKIPTKNPPSYSCGTKHPIWLNGTEPYAVNEIKSIQACAVDDENSCFYKTEIKVKKCLQNNDIYFVYYLPKLPNCSMQFCAGSEKKCDSEESSLTGFTPCTSPCLEYRVIDDFQRSTAFKVDPNISLTCVKPELNSAWYRFTSGAGGKIPTKNPSPYSCGVKNPVWLNGTEPSRVNETTTVQACAVVDEDSCAKKINVKIKKCLQNREEYFVYYLQELPSCSMRYCAGSKKKCGPEENSATGFTPCSSDFPKINQDPVVTVGVENKRIKFTCKFNTIEDNKARYEVTWFQGPDEIQIQGPEVFTSDQNEVLLYNKNKYGETGTFCMGHNIYCKVRSFYIGNENIKSRLRKSNEFFAGLQVNPKVLVLSEKDRPMNVTIKSTVPIICGDGTENCKVLVEIGQTATDHFVDYCTLQLEPGPAGQTKELEVVAKRDFVDDGNQRMFLKISIPDHIDPIDWNCHKHVNDLEIKTIDVRTSRCTSSGDPHITTFDQFYYAHLYVGDYVLVQSTTRNFKVHARTFACSQSVSCNCGVAAQEGDDIIVIDMCRDSVPRVRFASSVEPKSGTSITRDNNGKIFVINFPSGASVKFSVFNWFGHFANIEVQVPSDDYQGTQGLCGTFDRNRDNDMMAKNGSIYQLEHGRFAKKEFSESWKLNRSSDNLFYVKGGPRKCTASRAKSYCVCSEFCGGSKRTVNCDFEGFVDRPKYINGFIGWKKLEFPGAEHCGRRKRRSMDSNVVILPDDGNTGVYDYNPIQVYVNISMFPTKSNITENDAKNICKENVRNSVVGKACIKVIGPSFTTDKYEQQCVLDIQVTDNTRISVDSAINTLISACEELTLRNLSFWMNTNRNITAPPSEIAESLCPNECNKNGVCKNGTCHCNLGYITADCSLKDGQTPILIGLTNSGLCDIREQDCIRTRVIGRDFIDSIFLSCRMMEVKISEKPYEKSGNTIIENGQLLSFSEISCLLPYVPVDFVYSTIKPGKPVGGYTISVSNNKINFTENFAMLIVYDSKCMECNITDKTCKWKDNSCKINEYCFAKDDPNPKEWCEVCNPVKSKTSFSKRTNNIPPWFKKNISKQYAFKGQQWNYIIPAFDPENQPLKYEFQGETFGMKISSTGVLTWSPAVIGNYSFVIKVTDPCGLSDSAKFEVETMQCYCEGKNDGFCIWKGEPGNNNMSNCQCPKGCSGEQCTQPIDGLICRIRVTKQVNEKSKKFSVTILTVIIVTLVIILAIFVLVFVVHLKKKNKIVFQEKDESKGNTNVFSKKSVIDSAIPLNDLKIPNEGYKNEAFIKNDEIQIKCRKTAWQT